jgi:hypothetical protein
LLEGFEHLPALDAFGNTDHLPHQNIDRTIPVEILADLSHLGLVSFFGSIFRPSVLQQFFKLLLL